MPLNVLNILVFTLCAISSLLLGRFIYSVLGTSELSSVFSTKTLNEINDLLRNAGVTYGVLGRTTDHKNDIQFLETETLVKLKHEGFEDLLTINSPITIKDEKKKESYRAPKVGEHTREVLDEMGIDESTQDKLHEEGAIFWS